VSFATELLCEDFPHFFREPTDSMKSDGGGMPSCLAEPGRRSGCETAAWKGANAAQATSTTGNTGPPADCGARATHQQISTALTGMV